MTTVIDPKTKIGWTTTAFTLQCTDGYGIHLAGPPLSNFFTVFRQSVMEDAHAAVGVIRRVLSDKEYQYKLPALRRAGHLTTFHTGEQVHCGVGNHGYVCSLTKFPCRVVLYGTAIPTRFLALYQHLKLVGTEESTWGLMREIDVDQVPLKIPNLFIFLCCICVVFERGVSEV